MTSTLAALGLTVVATPGAMPADPCAAHYSAGQVAVTATYLDAQDAVVTDTSGQAVIVGAASGNAIPSNAWGVKISALSACQPAAFGALLGHPYYSISVAAMAGQPLPSTALTPATAPRTATPTPAGSATPLPPIIQ